MGLLRKMIMSMTYVRIAAGEDVFCEGEIGETFYVIVTGVLSVNVEGSGVVKKMGAGESFGEMALLDRQNCTRSATVTVEHDRDYCELCVVSRKDFEDSVGIVMAKEMQHLQDAYAKAAQLAFDLSTDKGGGGLGGGGSGRRGRSG